MARPARVSRPRRSVGQRSPGEALTAEDCGRRGRAGQETLPEPGGLSLLPLVDALSQYDLSGAGFSGTIRGFSSKTHCGCLMSEVTSRRPARPVAYPKDRTSSDLADHVYF